MSSEDPFPRRRLSDDPEPGHGVVWVVLLVLVVVLMCMEGSLG